MALFGYIILCIFGLLATAGLALCLRFGGFELGPAKPFVWLIILPLIVFGWYVIYLLAPFELVMK